MPDIQNLKNISSKKQEILNILQHTQRSYTYDRLASKIGYSVYQYRSISQDINDLLEQEFVIQVEKMMTTTGTKAYGYKLHPDLKNVVFPWQETLFAIQPYNITTEERIYTLVRSLGKKNIEGEEVAATIVNILIGTSMENNMIFHIEDENISKLFYIQGSETSQAAAEQAQHFSSKKRQQVYMAIEQGFQSKGRGITRNEGISISGIWPSTFLPRTKELIDAGYLRVEEIIVNPTTGVKNELLIPTGKVTLKEIRPSSFSQDRLKIFQHATNLLVNKRINGIYLSNPKKFIDEMIPLAQEFIKKHAKVISVNGHENKKNNTFN